ncbi:hypothetical protein N7507_008241 [Penicillium longicatenatum]|nr:hypothetical protein N7507_008241 [Penicillium longicatenatum]
MRGKNAQSVALDVMKWMEMTMGIRGLSYPPHINETEDGDLVLDRRFQGKVYLKGMLLPASAFRSRIFRAISRDRQTLLDTYEEADIVRRIWESAIRKHQTAMLPIYINLLRNFPQAVNVESADLLNSLPPEEGETSNSRLGGLKQSQILPQALLVSLLETVLSMERIKVDKCAKLSYLYFFLRPNYYCAIWFHSHT